MKQYFIISLFFMLIFILRCDSTHYTLTNAPKSKNQIADYEHILTKKQYYNLLSLSEEINQKYGVKVFFLSVYSLDGCTVLTKKAMDVIDKRNSYIFSLTTNFYENNPVIIFTFSKHDNYFSNLVNFIFRKMINEEEWDAKRIKIVDNYFKKEKYAKAFEEILILMNKELLKGATNAKKTE